MKSDVDNTKSSQSILWAHKATNSNLLDAFASAAVATAM
jgi:hypothetical protein